MGRHTMENCIHLVRIIFNGPNVTRVPGVSTGARTSQTQPLSANRLETRVCKTTILDGQQTVQNCEPREREKVSYTVTQLPAWTQFPGHQILERGPHIKPGSLAKLRK